MNKRIGMQALAGVFALGMGTALASPEPTRPTDPTQPTRPSAGSTMPPTPTPTPPPTPGPADTSGTTTGSTTATSAPPAAPLTASESKQAKRVLTDIHNVNALEITLGRLAQQKAESQSIKDYAQMLVTDHESADKKVMDFASANNIMLASMTTTGSATTTGGPAATGAQGTTGTANTTAGTNPSAGTGNSPATAGTTPPTSDVSPIELPAAERRIVTKLEKLEGTKFEKAYLTEMVNGHRKTLGKLKAAEKSTKNAELKTLLGDISSSVQMHLDKAKELQRAGSASLGTTNVPQ